MKVIVKYLNGYLITYDDADDVDEQFETVDIYLTSGRCLELDKNKVKKVTAVYDTPAGEQTSQIYFNHKPLIKKEVNTMKETEKNMITEETAAELAEELTAEEVAAEAADASDFDFASEYNHKGVLFTIETEGMEAHKAAEVYAEIGDSPLIMRGLFINPDKKFGKSVSVITTNSIIFFGKSNVETAEKIRENEKAVAALNASGAWFKITEFTSKKYDKKGYAFVFLKKSEIPAEVHEDDACFKW